MDEFPVSHGNRASQLCFPPPAMSDDVDGDGDGGAATFRTFRSLIESADRKFARVRDLPAYERCPLHMVYYRKVFKSYTRLWRFQQEHRRDLVAAGLRRWEIGEIASRIGQLYYGQYQRTSEARFLLESYIFYEAILSRRYFEPPSTATEVDLGLRYKELRFHARFLIVAMLLNRKDVVMNLAERFRALVEDSKSVFRDSNFKEWNQVLQETFRFLKADTSFTNTRPLRYSLLFDSHPSSLPYIARLHKRRVLKLQDAVLTSYRRNEIKITELTLDSYRMIQCLEWEPSGSFYQVAMESSDNGVCSDQSGASGLIDINFSTDMTDPSVPVNPRKAVLYHSSVSHLMTVLATICEELSSDSILLIYIAASGKIEQASTFEKDSSRVKPTIHDSYRNGVSLHHAPISDRQISNDSPRSCLWLGSRGSAGVNHLYPEDLIPFTRKPLFIIIDSENSHAFKDIHGSEKGEAAALLLSPRRPLSISSAGLTPGCSQFTYFLTAPLLAFIQLLGLKSDIGVDVYSSAESLLSSAIAEWEVILCTSEHLDQVWSQVLPDPFLRRLILRFIFCRAVLSLLSSHGKDDEQLPHCLPSLPEPMSPDSPEIQSHIWKLAETLGVVGHFNFLDNIKGSTFKR